MGLEVGADQRGAVREALIGWPRLLSSRRDVALGDPRSRSSARHIRDLAGVDVRARQAEALDVDLVGTPR